jgi:GNAT superfamily N-acetyltransferase
MSAASTTPDAAVAVRPLRTADLDAVVAIDRSALGRSRRGFFAKRLQAAAASPDVNIAVAAESSGHVAGFMIATVLAGEFGHSAPVAIVEAVGVAEGSRRRGIARTMLEALEREARSRGIAELHTQARWNDGELLAFFDAAGFALAPRCVLERSTDEPVEF